MANSLSVDTYDKKLGGNADSLASAISDLLVSMGTSPSDSQLMQMQIYQMRYQMLQQMESNLIETTKQTLMAIVGNLR